jgi:hypothetical protein
MARQIISTGSAANDGTGDTLRSAANKINANFAELYEISTGDSSSAGVLVQFKGAGIQFEGSSIDANKLTLRPVDPTATRAITIPDHTGVIVLDTDTQTLTNKTLTAPEMTLPAIQSGSFSYDFQVGSITGDRDVTLPVLQSDDTFVFEDHAATLTNKTLTSPTISSPTITTEILDANGASFLTMTPIASAVNNIEMKNAVATDNPEISVTGTDTNINLSVTSKGTGSVVIDKVAYETATVSIASTAPANQGYVIFNSNTAIAVGLDDGTTVGEQKIFTNKGNGTITMSPTNLANGSTFDITSNQMAICIWDGTNWFHIVSS